MQYAESQRYRQRRGAPAGGVMSTIDSFFQHKQMKNEQAQQSAYSNAEKAMAAVASGTLKAGAPALGDALVALNHYDPQRAAIYAAQLKKYRSKARMDGEDIALKYLQDLETFSDLTRYEVLMKQPPFAREVLHWMEHKGEISELGNSPEEMKRESDKARVLQLKGMFPWLENQPLLFARLLEYDGILPTDTLTEAEALVADERQRKIEEANAKEQIEFDWAMKKHRAQKDYGFEIFQKKGKFKTESGAREAADEAVEKAAGWAYDEHESERKRRKAEIVAWVKEWGPNAAPESRSGIRPPKPEEIPHVPFKKFLDQIDPDFYADFTRRAAAARTGEDETQGGITVPEEPRQGVAGELAHYDPPEAKAKAALSVRPGLTAKETEIVERALKEGNPLDIAELLEKNLLVEE